VRFWSNRLYYWLRSNPARVGFISSTLPIVIPPPIGKRSIVMTVSVYVCVFVCLRSYLRIYLSDLHQIFLCELPMAVARSSSGGVVICYVLPVLWMTSYLLISQGCSTSPPSWSAVHTRPWAWWLYYRPCAVLPVAGQRTHETTFRALIKLPRW